MDPQMMDSEEMVMRDRAKHRGRAYQCLACYYKEGKTWLDEKRRMEEHILKTHVRLDEVPYYCRLCLFKCQKWDTLVQHLTSYAPHVEMVQKKGYVDNGQAFMVKSSNPYKIGPLDYLKLEQEDSIQHWLQASQRTPKRSIGKINQSPQATAGSTTYQLHSNSTATGWKTPESTNRVNSTVTSQMVAPLNPTGWISIPETPGQLPDIAGMLGIGAQQPAANLYQLQQGWQVASVPPMPGNMAITEDATNQCFQMPALQPAATETHAPSPADESQAHIVQTNTTSPKEFVAELPSQHHIRGGSTQEQETEVTEAPVTQVAEVHETSLTLEQEIATNLDTDATYGPVEDITDQLLGDEEMVLSTPVKRNVSETEDPTAPSPKSKFRKTYEQESKQKDIFNIDRVTANTLVNEMRGLKEALNSRTKADERIEKGLTEVTCVLAKLTDAINRFRNVQEDHERAEKRREERRQEAERRKEEETRREKEEDRRREERRREVEKKERESHRRKDEQENNPRTKSVLARSYTENSIKDLQRRK